MTSTTPTARCLAVLEGGQLPSERGASSLIEAADFAGRAGELLLVSGDLPTLLVGCGPANRISRTTIKDSFGRAAGRLRHLESVEVDFQALYRTALSRPDIAEAVALGLRLGEYQLRPRRSGVAQPPIRWLCSVEPSAWSKGLASGARVCQARDAVNQPGNILNPKTLAQLCVDVGSVAGLEVTVRDENWLEQQGAGGILAIGRSSACPPVLVEIVHRGDGRPQPDLCLVGKGVTFDTGGLSLKGASEMISMQHDMASVAAITYAMAELPTTAPRLHVRALCPLVENMIGPDAARPGDIVTSRNGKTIEILNTDFEGRVILADALALASEHRPNLLVDIATLTYGAIAALGPRMAALFGDDVATRLVEHAAERADEPVWRLPLQEYLAATVRSSVADVRNFPELAEARATTAALFLREFVEPEVPWAHLDIAGPAWSQQEHGSVAQGGTGFGVRLLDALFEDLGRNRESVSPLGEASL